MCFMFINISFMYVRVYVCRIKKEKSKKPKESC